jgi:hypothetical protein
VSALEHGSIERMRTRTAIRCGDCGTWRELVVPVWTLETYGHRLARERQRIADTLARLERAGMAAAAEAFIAALQRDLIEPADFAPDGPGPGGRL